MLARALVVAPSSIGDAVMTQPLLALLRQQAPLLPIDTLCTARVAPVFRAMPEVDTVIEDPCTGSKLQLLTRWRLGRRLRTRHYLRAYVLQEHRGAALVPWFARIAQRIGYPGAARTLLLNRIHECERPVQRAELFAGLAFEAGAPLPGAIPDPKLLRQPDRERAVRARFGFGRERAPIVLCPGAGSGSAGRWPARHFAALISLLASDWPETELLLIGSAAERTMATEIAALSGQSARNLCGETTLEEAGAIIAQAAGVVSADTGLMHLAAAFGRPQVAVFGPTDPRRAPPRSARAQVEWLHLSCSPCAEDECPLVHHACMNRITPEQVFESLTRVMRFETSGARPAR